MKTFVLFRHGETEWNAKNLFQGHTDIPLNEKGKKQARDLIQPLSMQKLEAVISSDLSRAIQTATPFVEKSKLPFFQDSRLREAHLGQMEGRDLHQISTLLGKSNGQDLVEKWRSTKREDYSFRYPGGESGDEVLARVIDCLREFSLSHPETRQMTRIGVSTHGGIIRRMVALARNFPDQSTPIPNGIIYSVEIQWAEPFFRFHSFSHWSP